MLNRAFQTKSLIIYPTVFIFGAIAGLLGTNVINSLIDKSSKPSVLVISENLPANDTFTLLNSLSCTIIHSSETEWLNRGLTLTGLREEEDVIVTFSDQSGGSPMKKIYEDDDTIVIELLASLTGSTDVLTLNTTTGHFVRTTTGNYGTLGGVRGSISYGYCK